MTAHLSPRLAAWQAGGEWMNWQGERIFFKRAGCGPALLLVHGYPVGSYDWHTLWEGLTAHFTVIAADIQGHGFSGKPSQGDYSLRANAQMHDALLAHLGICQCQVIAFDLGVSVAQEMRAQRKEAAGLPMMKNLVFLTCAICHGSSTLAVVLSPPSPQRYHSRHASLPARSRDLCVLRRSRRRRRTHASEAKPHFSPSGDTEQNAQVARSEQTSK